jgi:hypothetical protein
MHNHFPMIPIIFLIRHPLANAASRMLLQWDARLNTILRQPNLIEDHLADYIDDIRKCDSIFNQQIYLWCIGNYVALRQLEKEDCYFLFYEHLCMNPHEEISKLFQWLGKDSSQDVEASVRKPSDMSTPNSAIQSGENLVTGWKKHVDRQQAKDAINILKRFGLDRLYDEDPYPKVESIWD